MTTAKCYKDPELNSTKSERDIYDQWKQQEEYGHTFSHGDYQYFAHSSGKIMKEKENHIILVDPSSIPNELLEMIVSVLIHVNSSK